MTVPSLAIVCCGRFHYDRYVGTLEGEIRLSALYYSYKLSHRIDVKSCRLINLWLKEYLLGLHIRIFGRWALKRAMPFYHWVWSSSLLRVFQPADINLFLMHGNCLGAIRAAKRSGSLVVCEAVNAHPGYLHDLLTREREQLGLPAKDVVMNREQILAELELADFLLCPSRSVAHSYIDRGFDPAKVVICPYGVPNLRRAVSPAAIVGHPSRASILVVAQLDVRKGIHRLLQALSSDLGVRSMLDVTLVGVGDAEYAAILRSTYPEVSFVDHIPNQSMLEYMQSYSMTCLPSLEDGFGLVVLESLAAGVPALVSKYAGSADYVERFGGGVVFDPLQPASVVAAVKAVLNGNYPKLTGSPPTWDEYAFDLARKLRSSYELRELYTCA